jgi:hypothetical protein
MRALQVSSGKETVPKKRIAKSDRNGSQTNGSNNSNSNNSNWPTVNIRAEFLRMFKCAYEAKKDKLFEEDGVKSFSGYMNEKIFRPLIYQELSTRQSIKGFRPDSVIVHDSVMKKNFEVKIQFPKFYCVEDRSHDCGDVFFAMNSPEVQGRLSFKR